MKAQEFRNMLLFFFPIILSCIESQYENEHKLWLLLTYAIRACIIPNNEFSHVNIHEILSSCHEFYYLFHSIFGPKNCSYSVHIVSSHLLKIRGNQPLTFKSAFKFESFYAEMKNSFAPGTTSTLKQILQNVLMKRSLEFHTCCASILYKPDKVPKPGQTVNLPKECNCLVYTFEQNEHVMYKIVSVSREYFTCVKQGHFQASFNCLPRLNWSSIGVYRVGPLGCTNHRVPKSAVCGKVIHVLNYLITCPSNILREK